MGIYDTKSMKKTILIFASSIIFLTGCFRAKESEKPGAPGNEVARSPDPAPDINNPKPNEPIIADPDIVGVPVVYKHGECTKDPYQVVSCMNCQIDQRPLATPLSEKATRLLKIMELGCAIRHKSDPKNYHVPSRAEILKYVNRATEAMYPDSPMTKSQKKHIDKWLNNDGKYLKRLFSGPWYNPPYTDDFETYFGLEAHEARYMFCFEQPRETFSLESVTMLRSSKYIDCIYNDGFTFNCRELPEYVKANEYRTQLLDSIIYSLSDPANDQELVPSNKCRWETITGNYDSKMEAMVNQWKMAGYQLAVSYESGQPRCESISSTAIPLNAKVTVAGKWCEKF